ncbi:MAG: putative baseplate assembly protein [Sphingomonadaceae bacterium]
MSVAHPAFCRCCRPATRAAPAAIWNRPGLSAIAWRPGTFATFRQAMLEALAEGPRRPDLPADPRWPDETRAALAALTSRAEEDGAILNLSLFAAIADVLGLYSERIANEMFVRTATERDSLVRLARLLGHDVSPGSAATAWLSFRLDAGAALEVRAGTKVMSVPARQDEKAQTFETLAALSADARLNHLPVFGPPASVAPFPAGALRIALTARPAGLRAGDTLALVAASGAAMALQKVAGLATDATGEVLLLERPVPAAAAGGFGFRVKRALALFGHDLPPVWTFYDTNPTLHPTQRWRTLAAGASGYPVNLAAAQAGYALDRRVEDLREGALLLVDRGAGTSPRYSFASVTSISADSASRGPLSGTVTWVGLQPVAPLAGGGGFLLHSGTGIGAIPDLRRTRLFEVEQQPILPRTSVYPEALTGGTAWLRAQDLGGESLLEKGRRILLFAGERRHLAEITSVHGATAAGVAHLVVGFDPPLGAPLADARLSANLALASHGERIAVPEPLGHGEAARPFQRFRLRKKGVTHLARAGALLPAPELDLRVNGEAWDRADSLFGRTPADRVYTLRVDDAGEAELLFGDGERGARLPSGGLNVMASYRTGLGRDGRVKAGQLTTLLTRPPGLAAVTNPFDAEGGKDPEPPEALRTAVPAGVRTFGRAISLADFEDVARLTGLAARAKAAFLWLDLAEAIHLSVAGEGGARLSAAARATLRGQIDSVRDPNHPLVVGSFGHVPLDVKARLLRTPAIPAEEVEAAARAAFARLIAFDRWPLGSALHHAQVSAALQGARGVLAVDVERLHVKGHAGWTAAQLQRRGATSAPLQPFVRLFGARPRAGAGSLDPVALANLADDPEAPVIPAELPRLEQPGDLVLDVVDRL